MRHVLAICPRLGPLMELNKLKFASLFAGCGGFDAGFIKAGFQCMGAFDIDQTALDVHSRNLSGQVYRCDLSSRNFPGIEFRHFDVLLAGSPCQGFSTLGKRKLDDPRNDLLLVVGRWAARYKPKVVVAENVPGVISGKHRHYWEQLHILLHDAGYHTVDVRACGTEFGVAQRRSRVFMVAWMGKDITFSLPSIPGGTLKDALVGIGDVENHDILYLPTNSIHYQIAEKIKPDQKLSNVRSGPRSIHTWEIPEVFGPTTQREREALEAILRFRRQIRVRDHGDADPVPTEFLNKTLGSDVIQSLEKKGYLRRIAHTHDLIGAFNGKYRRLSWDKPSYTVDTRFGDPKYFLHPSEHRGFTVREAARIQGFPDTFTFHGTRAEQYRMVGNAVPPPMAYSIAVFIRNVLLG